MRTSPLAQHFQEMGQKSFAVWLTWAALLTSSIPSGLSAQQSDEYRVKAAYLYNFANFVDWPSYAFADSAEPFGICVLGQDPFGRALDNVVKGKTVSGRTISVRRGSDIHRTAGCHILFVSSSEHKRLAPILAFAKHPGVLTVGEAGNSDGDDVVINFMLEGGRVRFEVNLANAELGKLRLSPQLLRLAAIIRH